MADSISPSQDKKRLKKCNFSREGCLNTEGSGKNYIIINLKHSNIITNEKKKVWTEIAEKTN